MTCCVWKVLFEVYWSSWASKSVLCAGDGMSTHRIEVEYLLNYWTQTFLEAYITVIAKFAATPVLMRE